MKMKATKTGVSSSLLFFLFAISIGTLFSADFAAAQNTTTTTQPISVGVVIDFERWVGKLGLSCIEMALSDFYASLGYNYKTRLHINARDSKNDVIGAASAALDLIKNAQVKAIIGPQTSMQANFVVDLGEKAQVPIISFSATTPSLNTRSSYFFRATECVTTQIKAITSLVQAFGWRQVVPVYVDDIYEEGLIPSLTEALQQIDAGVPYRSLISPKANEDQIEKELYKLMSMQSRVFILHTSSDMGSRLLTKAKEIGMMEEGYVWIMTNGMTNNLFQLKSNSSIMNSMQGTLGIKTHVPKTNKLKDFRARWKRKFRQDNPDIHDIELNVFGLWAYDAAIALARAVEEVGIGKWDFKKDNNVSENQNTDLESFGVSQNGHKISEALTRVRFTGLVGDFRFVNRQLDVSTFEIINVNGNWERVVGFWTPEKGLVRNLSSTTTSNKMNLRDNLGPIIWPGEPSSTPKGWEMPINGKKLKIGVPPKRGFNEFVDVKYNNATNRTEFHGYCIDVFEAVVNALPFGLAYEFSAFAKPNGDINGTYDDLVYQVHLGNFDAVVGDVTIRFNRSLHVDFTLPFTESGVTMIVPVKDKRSKNPWVFLKPLTRDLWVTTFCFFVFVGFVVWVLEHRINEDFRGPPSHQIGTSFWFSFSTMVFSHRERVVSNLARFVVTVWIFVVLILTRSYTASLTSLLTVQQLQPTVTDLNQLLKNGENVGYLKDSFVLGLLKGLGFPESKLKTYESSEELELLFKKKKEEGGIAAVLDEYPYMKLFLAKYGSKYAMVEPSFKTDGFGFVFPKGSPLVPDISRAILTVTERGTTKEIEKKLFRQVTNYQDFNSQVSSNVLGLESFWGLFLIAGVASLSALIVFAAIFIYQQRQIITDSDRVDSIWEKVLEMLRIYDHKDLSSHTFKKNAEVE
ncbi:glutamate receptor 2.7 [Ziziphus jujuba]|uniref:Glutamate receptor n=1 Tax=Ziziphus jujuba TaxID=326968 RepID=A0ABM3ICK1_ZIZJJ|nr:glutamate receptor 2.7 [Ziziphus jujuba]